MRGQRIRHPQKSELLVAKYLRHQDTKTQIYTLTEGFLCDLVP